MFAAWVVFVKAVLSCLNIKPDDGVFLYNVPEVCNKTGHGLTNIIIAWDEFKPVLQASPAASFFRNSSTYIYCILEWN